MRAAAAGWVAERRITAAKGAIEKALKNEKDHSARAALLSALDAVGGEVEAYFSEKALKAEAEKGLKSAKLESLAWFPFAALPKLAWANGRTIPPEVVKWWIVLADKLKEPGGNAMFALYLDRMRPADASRLGLFVLDAFVERDTASPTLDEANAYARANVTQVYAQNQQWAKQYPDWPIVPLAVV